MISSMNLGFRLSFSKVIYFDTRFAKHYLIMSHLPSCVCPQSTGTGGMKRGRGIKASKDTAASLSSAEWFSNETLPKGCGSTVGQKATLPRRDQSSSSSPPAHPAGCFLFPAPQPPPSPSLPFIHLTLNEWHT